MKLGRGKLITILSWTGLTVRVVQCRSTVIVHADRPDPWSASMDAGEPTPRVPKHSWRSQELRRRKTSISWNDWVEARPKNEASFQLAIPLLLDGPGAK